MKYISGKKRVTGFKELKPGKIHMRCPSCGRKQSNMDRGPHDPERAFLFETECPDCSGGDFSQEHYYTRTGSEITNYDKG